MDIQTELESKFDEVKKSLGEFVNLLCKAELYEDAKVAIQAHSLLKRSGYTAMAKLENNDDDIGF